MSRPSDSVLVDGYVLDVLMRDLVGHDKRPAAFLVYVYLYAKAARGHWRPVTASLRDISDATGLSKSAAETAVRLLKRRHLVTTTTSFRTAPPVYNLHRHWRD